MGLRSIDMTDQVFGSLTVLERAPRTDHHEMWWLCVCDCGGSTVTTRSNLMRGRATSCGHRRGERPFRYLTDTPTYGSAHARVRCLNGSASTHACFGCGGPARDWAYMGDDPNELTAAKTFIGGRVLTVRYSADPQRYMPLCPSCHWHFDRGGE